MPEVASQPNQPQVINKPGFNWKSVLIAVFIGAAVIVVAVVGLSYYINQNQSSLETGSVTIKSATPSAKTATSSAKKDETSDWKTFTNSSAGWEIKYPSDWEVLAVDCGSTTAEQCDNVIIRGTNVKNAACLDPKVRCGSLQVILYGEALIRDSDTSGKDWVENGNEKSNLIEASLEVDIAGIKGYQQTFRNNPGNTAISRTITMLHNKKLYVLAYDEGYYQDNYHITSTKDWKLLSVFNKMVSTFKFL